MSAISPQLLYKNLTLTAIDARNLFISGKNIIEKNLEALLDIPYPNEGWAYFVDESNA